MRRRWEMIDACISFDCVVLLEACVRRLHQSLRRDFPVVDVAAALDLCPHRVHVLMRMSFDKVRSDLRGLIVVDDALSNEVCYLPSIN